MTVDAKESVLSRWSRRKQEARDAAQEAAAAPDPGESAAAVQAPDEAPGEQPLLTDADMPDIDSLTEESDFSPFMSAGVSDELRNLALRKLFRAPLFNIRDGLDEYDDDFTSFEKLGGIVTADMKHRIEMEQQKLREKLAQQEADGEPDEIEALDAEGDDAGEAATEVAALDDDHEPDATEDEQ